MNETHIVGFRIISEGVRGMRLRVLIDGAEAGTAMGYRDPRCKEKINVYPERVMYPYNRLGLDLRRTVWRQDLPWE